MNIKDICSHAREFNKTRRAFKLRKKKDKQKTKKQNIQRYFEKKAK